MQEPWDNGRAYSQNVTINSEEEEILLIILEGSMECGGSEMGVTMVEV